MLDFDEFQNLFENDGEFEKNTKNRARVKKQKKKTWWGGAYQLLQLLIVNYNNSAPILIQYVK